MPVLVSDARLYAELRRQHVAAHLRDTLGPDVAWPVEVIVGERAQAIADAARAHGASLIVMGTGRHDLAARVLGGEVTLRTIRRADVPVLTVAGELGAAPRVAVAAVDFSPSSVAAARAALALLDGGATLYLVHAWSRGVLDHPAVREADDAYERALPDRFAKVEAALSGRAPNVRVVSVSVAGKPADAVLAFARAHGAQLLAVGRRGHDLFERMFVGQVSAGLVRAASCPVLVTPEPPYAERVAWLRVLTGTVESRWPDEWVPLLDELSRRNAGRRTTLEIDDPALGAQIQETGRVLVGLTYDPHDRRVAIMIADAVGGAGHLTRAVGGVESVAVHNDAGGHDVAVRLTHGDGQTLLTFPPGNA